MTTVSSSTSNSTSSSTSTSASGSSILTALNAGSGIDTASLVSQLVQAQFAVKNQQLSDQADKLTAQISAVSELKSGITGFSSSLASLIRGGTLSTQPTSSNTGIVSVSALSGASISGLSGTIEVRQLAQPQAASSALIADKTAAIGTGKLTLTFGTATVDSSGAMTAFTAGSATPIDITIDSTNNSLTGIAAAINAKKAGVTASVVSDSTGSRLVLKGATGASQAFTLTATEDASAPGLSALNIGPGATGTTINSAAQDAIVAVDGVAVRRASNTISDVISGVQMNLVSASPGTKVTLGTQAPTSALSQAVSDFVDTYNQMLALVQKDTDAATGPLAADSAAKNLLSAMRRLTSTNLLPNADSSVPRTLAELGVSTNRDGTLSLDQTQLTTAVSSYPGAVEQMFQSGAGLAKALNAVATTATNTTYGLTASATRYTKAQSDLSDEQAKAVADAAAMKDRMTQQFAAMDSKVAAYKSTQSFLTNQVNAWNNSNK